MKNMKKRILPKAESPTKSNTSQTIRTEKAQNGFVIRQTVENKQGYKEKLFVAKTKKEAEQMIIKLL